MSKKWKVFLTMEFDGIVEAETEEEARDRLFFHIFNGYNDVKVSDIENGMPHYCDKEIENWGVKKWWGGANEVKK